MRRTLFLLLLIVTPPIVVTLVRQSGVRRELSVQGRQKNRPHPTAFDAGPDSLRQRLTEPVW